MTHTISGLLFEDRVRTTKMFLYGTVAHHPTHPIDIAAKADLVQGIPTHVKLKLKKKDQNGNYLPFRFSIDFRGRITCDNYNIDMACCFQLWSLEGDQRLVIGFYEKQTHYNQHGHRHEKIVVTEIIEIILTERTLQKLRKDVPVSEIEWIKAKLLAWKPNPKNEWEASRENKWVEDYLHPMTKRMRDEKRVGLASPVIHVDTVRVGVKVQNKRIQSTISTEDVVNEVLSENIGYGIGKYRNRDHPGSQVQDRVIFYDNKKSFHGLQLPWETLATTSQPAKGWNKLQRLNESKNRKPSVGIPTGKYAGCAQNLVTTTSKSIVDGSMVVHKFDDGWRILQIKSADTDVETNFAWACTMLGCEKLGKTESWLATLAQTKQIYEILRHHDLPPASDKSNLTETRSSGLYRINTKSGHYLASQLPSGDWVIRHGAFSDQPGRKQALEGRAACAFKSFGIQSSMKKDKFKENDNWIISRANPALLEEAASALINLPTTEKPRM